MSRKRLNIYLQPEHARRLNKLAVRKGLTKSFLVASALDSLFSPGGPDSHEAAIAKRLNQLGRQFAKLERDQNILIEMLGLFIRYYLSVQLSILEVHGEAAKAQGRARFQDFVQQLARNLQRGESLVREVYEEIFPEGTGSPTREAKQ